MVVAYKNGAPVMLNQVAHVVDGIREQQSGGMDEQHPGGDHEYSAPARREHHSGRRPNKGVAT